MKDKNVFDTHPKLKECFQTSDGTPFFQEHDAHTHARSLEDKEVKHLKRPVKAIKATKKKLTPMQEAQLRAEAIGKLETVEAVEAALKGETAKTVIAAGEEKIAAIKASIDNKEKTE